MIERPQTHREEVANSVSHGVACAAAMIAQPLLMMNARGRGAAALVGATVFGLSMIVLYLSSTMYHAIRHDRVKPLLRVVDHSAIYLLIAGSYTPFTLGILRGPLGWTLFAIVWTLAAAGVTLKTAFGVRHPRLSTALYLAMGWLALVAIKPLWLLLPAWGFGWLVAGGLFYTAGVVFFASDHRPYHHFVWHLFVMTGTACHFVAVWHYAA